MEGLPKGTVTSLSSLFPPEEAQKASKRVLDTIAERQKELDQLRDFAVDNTSLISLVQKLPDELHHDIMVPFGKAAFFPGRLIHTNEFLVLLGEGYYAERTSKQTIDLLKRRGKALESQVESLKAVMQDLKAEASFFEATAAELAEGLVEIREEYTEETPAEVVSNAGPVKPDPSNFSKAKNTKAVTEDEEFANFLSKIDELEKEELAEESDNECDENADEDDDEEFARMMSKLDEMEKKELSAESVSDYDKDEHVRADFGHHRSQDSFDHKHRSAELNMQSEGSKLQSVSGDKSPSDQSSTLTKSSSAEKASVLPEVNKKSEPDSQSRTKVLLADSGPSSATKSNSTEKASVIPEVKNSEAESQSQTKAFTGSIVEHSHNLQINPREQVTASFYDAPNVKAGIQIQDAEKVAMDTVQA